MHLTPTELERLTIFTAAELARRYLREGVRLSHPEAVAYLADELLLAGRKGMDHPAMVAHAATLLTHDQVEPGVPSLLDTFSVEVMMDEGTKLVTVFDPIAPGPFEPVPGEIIPMEGEIELNAGRTRLEIEVLNTGDRAIQVRSHAHFFEVNRALHFDRASAYGHRLDRPSGGGERFDPGVAKRVTLVPYGGRRTIHGFAGLTEGPAEARREAALQMAERKGYLK
ncbi:urease subunit beta [Salipiger thiooxidans]|uniref:urease subunit beta n=1 Tax=Salipiger thiooxidans TaxID=282683 RepID=UPI001CD23371|nr:urease subunit beta [Salipiger thiooxidans]MCA0847420.1 urease subunit beta [Salipiger thiooxidans]